jgi:glutamate synthase (ferredoxin)
VYGLIEKHYQHTRSPLAARVLRSWPQMVGKFVKVMPRDYKRMLEAFDRLAAEGYTGDELALAAFQLAQAEVDAVKVKHH